MAQAKEIASVSASKANSVDIHHAGGVRSRRKMVVVLVVVVIVTIAAVYVWETRFAPRTTVYSGTIVTTCDPNQTWSPKCGGYAATTLPSEGLTVSWHVSSQDSVDFSVFHGTSDICIQNGQSSGSCSLPSYGGNFSFNVGSNTVETVNFDVTNP
ncbi:MAG: hypothetical protein JRN35_06860 [Nitrososphaerota archaeon]|nr:hypothetical protein [Nitrososphaerota archaeon]